MKSILGSLMFLLLTSVSFAGGISGGGGGMIVPDPAGTNYVRLQLKGARTNLLFFLKEMSFGVEHRKLFDGDDNILEKVKKYSLKIETEKACVDFDGKPNDASINSDSNTICISAMTVGQKVSMLDDYPHLLALMAHEYSHLMGYDEAEAVAFQRQVLYATKSIYEGTGFSLGTRVSNEINVVGFAMTSAQWMIDKNKLGQAYKAVMQAENAQLFLRQFPSSALDKVETSRAEEIALRVKNIETYLCIQVEGDPEEKENCVRTYNRIFKDQDELGIEDFSRAYYGNVAAKPLGTVPNLLKKPTVLKQELQKIEQDAEKLSQAISAQLNLRD